MHKVNLIGYQVRDFHLVQNIQPGNKLRFENSYSYHATYGQDQVGRGEMKVTVRDGEDEKRFRLDLTIGGIFRFDPSAEKEEIHAESFKQLFPYAKAYISAVTAAGGLAPVMIPPIDIDDKTVYRVDLHPEDK